MRAYVTGGSGFVGRWLSAHLAECGDEVVLTDSEVDVTEPSAVAASLVPAAPDVVVHLAALAHVGRSWADPVRTFEVNALGTLRVLEAAASCATTPAVLVVSSAEVYGQSIGEEALREDAELRPVTPYASSKVAAEFLALQAFLGRGLRTIRLRPFNHVGPGQSPDFVVAALARRIARAERAGGGVVRVGNITASRDFTDVRDVVRAYRMLALCALSGEAPGGSVFNVATGCAVTIAHVAEQLCSLASAPVELEEDPELFRPVDVPVFLGDASALRAVTGWDPRIALEETLADVYEYWRQQVAGDG